MRKFWNIAANEIYIYGELMSEKWSESDVTAQSFINDLSACKGDVTVHINSSGGDVFTGVAIGNALKNYAGKVTVSIEGICASAATIVAISGDKIKMASNALFMIHEPVVGIYGFIGMAELEKVQAGLQAIRQVVIDSYKARAKVDVEAAIAAETYYSAKQALEAGFIDEITEEAKAVEDSAVMQERRRVQDLLSKKGTNAAVNKILDIAIENGQNFSEIEKYINAIKEVKPQGAVSLASMVADQVESGAAGVTGSTPSDAKKSYIDSLVKIANGLI